MRSFVAMELPDALLAALSAVQAGLPGRHVSEDNLHLTLAFLGDQPEPALAALDSELSLLKVTAPVLTAMMLDVFGGRKPALAVALVEPTSALREAQRQVAKAVRAAGITLARARFRPHITLCRFGNRGPAPQEGAALAARLGPLSLPGEKARDLSLVGSLLRPGGARYERLARYEFAG